MNKSILILSLLISPATFAQSYTRYFNSSGKYVGSTRTYNLINKSKYQYHYDSHGRYIGKQIEQNNATRSRLGK
jgi:hypothetical protein